MQPKDQPTTHSTRQFGLRTAFGALTFACVGWTVLRAVPDPDRASPESLLTGFVSICVITVAIYLLSRRIQDPGRPGLSALTAAILGTLSSGSIFGIAWGAYAPGKASHPNFVMIATIMGAIWAALFIIGGIASMLVWMRIRGRPDVWGGAICGSVTGFLSLAFADFASVQQAFIPAFIGGCYGAFAVAIQLAHAERRPASGVETSNHPVASIDNLEVPSP